MKSHSSGAILPHITSLDVKNMITFPHDLHLRPLRGVNVIFGGNFSGKTTLINAIRYGLFGLTLNRESEPVSARYFTSRIKESERSSLDINTICLLGKSRLSVNRRLFASGSSEIEATLTQETGDKTISPFKSVKTSTECLSLLTEKMNLRGNDEIKLITNLMFSDEERHTVLWSQGCEDLVLKLLVSPEEFSELHWAESELDKAKKEVDALKGEIAKTQQNKSDGEKIASHLKASLSQLAESKTEESVKAYDSLSTEIQKLRSDRSSLDSDFRSHLQENGKFLEELKGNDTEMLTTRGRKDKLEIERLRIFLTPEEPHAGIFMTHLLKEKKCPYCLADVSAQVQQRQDAKLCMFCGNVISIVPVRELTSISSEIEQLTRRLDEITENRKLLEQQLVESEEQISKIETDRQRLVLQETDLETRLEKMKDVEHLRQRRSTISQELRDVQDGLDSTMNLLKMTEKKYEAAQSEQEQLAQLLQSTKEGMKRTIDKSLHEVQQSFSKFIGLARNGEVKAELSDDLTPSIDGRRVFDAQDISSSERMLMDYAFRFAVLDAYARRTSTVPLMVVETPEEAVDESYSTYLAGTMVEYSKHMLLITTTKSASFMKELLEPCELHERKKRLIDLVSTGTTTQTRYYQPTLVSLFGGA